jgi:uncharacterized protein YbaR (Trm112 family)
MSDTSTSIVPQISDYPDRFLKATEIVDWLVSLKAVNPIKSDCILSSEPGYPISDGAQLLVNEPKYLPYGMIINGLEIVTKRTVFDAGENGLDGFVCPACNEDILAEEWNLAAFHETGNSLLVCPICKQVNEINDYLIEPAWAFSNLGFTFWNWPGFKDEILEEFEKRLNCKVKVVESHL